MTVSVDQLLARLFKHEGGYVDDPADRGGATKYGITIGTLSQWRGRRVTKGEVKALRWSEAKEIYKRKYLANPRIDELPAIVVPVVFDMGVNSGPKTAIRKFQRLLNKAGFGPLSADGVIGPQTIGKAANAAKEMGRYLVNAFVEERIKFYEALVRRRPRNKKFLRGWKKRAKSFLIK